MDYKFHKWFRWDSFKIVLIPVVRFDIYPWDAIYFSFEWICLETGMYLLNESDIDDGKGM